MLIEKIGLQSVSEFLSSYRYLMASLPAILSACNQSRTTRLPSRPLVIRLSIWCCYLRCYWWITIFSIQFSI